MLIGRITSIAQDFFDKGIQVTITLKNGSLTLEELHKLSRFDELQIDMKKYRKPRSKDANAYFHVLVGKIADSMYPPMSKARVKNILIGRYGQQEMVDGEPVHIKTEIGADKMLEQENLHCVPCGSKVENGRELHFYNVYRHTKELDSKEFSILLDGTIEECKQLGIETLSPKEVERIVQAWKPKA